MDIKRKIQEIFLNEDNWEEPGIGYDIPLNYKKAIDQLAALFERGRGRVLWEGEGTIYYDPNAKLSFVNILHLPVIDGFHGEPGQEVWLVVYEKLPEKQAEIEKATEDRGMDEQKIHLILKTYVKDGRLDRQWAVDQLTALFEREMEDEIAKALDSYIIQLDACKREIAKLRDWLGMSDETPEKQAEIEKA